MNTENVRNLFSVRKDEHFIGSFPVQAFSLNAVHMRKDQVDGVLRKAVKGLSFRNDIAKQGVIFFDPWLLAGLHGIAEEQVCFFSAVNGVFERSDVGKFSAIVRQDKG